MSFISLSSFAIKLSVFFEFNNLLSSKFNRFTILSNTSSETIFIFDGIELLPVLKLTPPSSCNSCSICSNLPNLNVTNPIALETVILVCSEFPDELFEMFC